MGFGNEVGLMEIKTRTMYGVLVDKYFFGQVAVFCVSDCCGKLLKEFFAMFWFALYCKSVREFHWIIL